LLDHEVFADQLDVGRHRPAVVGCGRAARDMRWRAAALVFGAGQVEKPVGDVDALDRRVDDVAEA
jgi:hypothetical protein